MEMNRRTLAKGAAWAAPVVVASAAVPAYAASQEPCATGGSFTATSPGKSREGATTVWTVPAGVNSICFDVLGGAGGTGGTNNVPMPGGAGARVTGILPVSPGDQLTLIVGAGGANARRGAQQYGTEVSLGGTGYGDGGDVNVSILTGSNVTSGAHVAVQRMGGSGGAGSAILLNGQPVVIAGGGGGGGNNPTFTGLWLNGTQWKGAPAGSTNSNNNHPAAQTTTSSQVAGSAGGSSADATGMTVRTNNSVAEVPGATYTFGSGAKAGAAGVGGTSGPDDGTANDTAYNLEHGYAAGGTGESVSAPGPAKGGNATALDNTVSYVASRSARAISIGGAGGGGYGGGGAGSSAAWFGTYKGSTGESYYFTNMISTGNPGAAGGSYVAPSVNNGSIAQGDNSNTTPGGRTPGAISFTF